MRIMVSYEEFAALDIRIGTVLEAEDVPKSRNLLKLKVDLSEPQPRQIIAGISKE